VIPHKGFGITFIVVWCWALALGLWPVAANCAGRQDEKAVLRLFYQKAELVTTASRMPEDARTAPAIVEVFTAEDLRNMGARTLSDLLRTLESTYVATQPNSREYVWMRGIRNRYNDKVLLLVDGIPRRDLVYEHASIDEYLPLTNIARIEITRGPGSALYGTNAYAGIINVITKRPPKRATGDVEFGGGNYNSREGNVEGGFSRGTFGMYGYGHWYRTDGDGLDINIYQQKQRLRQNPRQNVSGGFTFTLADFTFQVEKIHYYHTYFSDWDVPIWRWKDEGYFYNDTFLSATYAHRTHRGGNVKATLYYQTYDLRNYWRDFFPGRQGPGSTPADVRNEIFVTKQGYRLGGEFQYAAVLSRSHKIVAGATFERETLTNVQDQWHNLHQDTIESLYYIRPVTLDTWAVYAQDTWRPTAWLAVTSGLRGDHYQTFGWKVSPRLGVAVFPGNKLVLKLLYGEAFRAPSAREFYTVDLTGSFPPGNTDLKPESVRTVQGGVFYTFSPYVQSHLVLYYEHSYDTIFSETNRPYMNHSGYDIRGLETGVRLAWPNHITAYANYSYTGGHLYDVPHDLAHAGLNVPWGERVNWNINAVYVSDRPRDPKDLYRYAPGHTPYRRPDVPAFLLVNTTLRFRHVRKGLELDISVYNLLNRDYSDPTYEPTKYYDLKNPNRTFMLRAVYKF
jgi:iron complex outermembrane receptor protein